MLLGGSVGCSPRTETGVGQEGGNAGEGLASPEAGSDGDPSDGEGGRAAGGSSNGSAGSGAATGGDLAGGNGGSTTTGGVSGAASTGGTDSGGTTPGGTDSGGTTPGGTDSGGSGSQAGTAGTGGSARSPPDLTIVRPTAGCGLTAPSDLVVQQYVERTIETAGHKENSYVASWCHPGESPTYDWSFTRRYAVRLPSSYDPAKAYPLVLVGSCAAIDEIDAPVPDIAEQVIQVFFAPVADACPAKFNRCYDTGDGDNSFEFPFYERVWERLSSELCFDQNRVFTTGWGGGGGWANELGCVYAGHAKYPIRAIGAAIGGLSSPQPTCGGSPMGGLWIQSVNYASDYRYQIDAGERAARLGNGCPGPLPSPSDWTNYAVPGLNDGTCWNIAPGCTASSPLVHCRYGGIDPGKGTPGKTVADRAFGHFFSSFFAP